LRPASRSSRRLDWTWPGAYPASPPPVAKCGTLTITARQERAGQYPVLLTVDAPHRVLEAEFTDHHEGAVLMHVEGPRQPLLLEAAKPFIRDPGLVPAGQFLN